MQRVPRFGQVPSLSESQTPSLAQKCIAEGIGTAFLVYIGCGALTASSYFLHGKAVFSIADLLPVAVAFGLALAVMAYAIGHISNCHLNPAVSLGLACVGRMSWSEAGAYIVAQFVGGIVGAFLIAVTFGGSASPAQNYGATDYAPQFVNYFGAIVVEAITTFFLLFVIMATAIDKRAPAGWAGFAIGVTLMLCVLVAGPVTGANLNPARALGPTIVQLLFGTSYPVGHMFVYFIGPVIGGVLGALAYEYLAHPHAAEKTYRTPEPGY